MRNFQLFVFICLVCFTACTSPSYHQVLDEADSFSLYIYDAYGQNPIVVDSGIVIPSSPLHSLAENEIASNTDCTPNALVKLYKNGKSFQQVHIFLNGSCMSLSYRDKVTTQKLKLSEDGLNFVTQHNYPAMKPLLWLAGTWRTTDSLPFIEQWTWNKEKQMLEGQGLKVVAGTELSLKPLEGLKLTCEDGVINYIAEVKKQNEAKAISFTLKEEPKNDNFTFVNPQHDFPQKISYQRIAEDSIQITVGEFAPGGKEFQMILVKTQDDPDAILSKLRLES